MPRKPIGSVRRSQLITTYGIGAVVAVGDESVMVCGLDKWNVSDPDLQEPRLERALNVHGFAVPPATEDDLDIPVIRFPTMVYCPTCERLDKHKSFARFDDNRCNDCDGQLVPSRFVVACEDGHIDDFPYFRWVHAGMAPTKQGHKMKIQSGGLSASLKDIRITCSCGASVSMDGAFDRNALRDVGYKCAGLRPWLGGESVPCDKQARTLQRGASNVWFPVVRSALSIPPWSEGTFKVLNKHWKVLKHTPDDVLDIVIRKMGLGAAEGYSVQDLVEAVKLRKRRDPDSVDAGGDALRAEEFEALVRGKPEVSGKQDFVCVEATEVGALSKEWFDRVMMAKRLREVRAIESFTRVFPPGSSDPPERRAPLALSSQGWLPAIEVTGEGVFLNLRSDKLEEWEQRDSVVARVEKIDKNYRSRFESLGEQVDRRITPRLVMVHTLAHALINQWSLESGYPAAALRERLYVSDSMAGFLVYTATTDSAGSLGGVVAQAEGGRLSDALQEGLTNAAWCSADPLCIEAGTQGTDSLNLAACHACVLLPEVSCEEMNTLLDRALLVGTPEHPEIGFFSAILEGVS